MYNDPLKLLLFLLAFFSLREINAQSLAPTVIASDGGFAVVSSGTISWSLGETVTETFTSTNNFLTQGFQQPSGLNLNGVGTASIPGLNVYPNPATDVININLNAAQGLYTIELFDLLGNKVSAINVMNPGIVSLPLSEFANGVYMLTVSSAGFSQSYKVIKSK